MLVKIKMLLNYFSFIPYEFYCLKKNESRALEVESSQHYRGVPINRNLFPREREHRRSCGVSLCSSRGRNGRVPGLGASRAPSGDVTGLGHSRVAEVTRW